MSETVIFEPFKTVPLTRFRPELRFEFPDLPEQLFDYALIRSARTLAKEGNVLHRRIVIKAQPNVCRYSLRSPDGLEVVAILGIKLDTCCYTVDVRRTFVAPDRAQLCPRQVAWYDDIEDCLNIYHDYCHGVYYVSAAVCPPDAVCDLPDVYYNDYMDLLLLGAKARILRMNNKPWTNMQLALMYEKGFYEGIADASVEKHLHKQRGRIKMQFGRVM